MELQIQKISNSLSLLDINENKIIKIQKLFRGWQLLILFTIFYCILLYYFIRFKIYFFSKIIY
jgi:hypothetical protein